MANLHELKYFLSVADTLNVSRAAELLGLSQPALSHALKRLENEVGVQLLHREKTGVRLTRAGERFALQSKDIFEKWESLSKSVKSTDTLISGHYKIGCHPSVAIYSLPHFLKKLQTKYPELEVSLSHGSSREVASAVIQWRIDFGLVINPPQHPDLVIRHLGTDEVTLWQSSDAPVMDTLILDPEMLQAQSIIKQLEKKKVRFKRKIESTNLEVIRALTAAGSGIGILPTRVAQHSGGSVLRRFNPGNHSFVFKDELCLVHRVGIQDHASGKAIIESVVNAKI